MADIETKTISLALYRYMYQNIIGSENHVKNLRLMNTVRDNMTSQKFTTFITSGSFGEGLEMRGSDLDVMYVIRKIEVYENVQTSLNSNALDLLMETDDVKAGFARLQVKHNYSQSPVEYFEDYNGKHYFSSTLYKQSVERHSNSVIHGPCISDKEGNFDSAICLHCRTWISQASQWIKRSNNSWPSYNVKQSIIKHGVLFVPVGVKGSPRENIEWRISFSVGEKFLINTFTHTQLLCYALLKILLKDVISTYTECEDLLCSYFLKTIMFWISEELPQSIWKPETLIHCFMRCLRRLIYSVDYSICLHYFIPENNLFENKIEGRADNLTFKINSGLIPNELQMEVKQKLYRISSIVYAYFLKILCHYHLNNVRQCQDCLQTLQVIIDESYFIENEKLFHSESYKILGIALQLLGDSESAQQAFMQSAQIEPDQKYNTSVKRLTLMNSL
ncbi:cyclic GMP-AMP synthase-like [Mytilus trossulus]|uniref:cyclic GMP-AMP synthase-like n=1 Tax=Mytilus trossulus TaxID=6551 RepID=UPI0030050BEB